MATLLIGYDVETLDEKSGEETRKFLKVASQLHRDLGVPATFFICGKTLEDNLGHFQAIKERYSDILDFQQHTYSHVLLKTVCQERDSKVEVFKGGTLEQIKEEVARTNELLGKYLEVNCIGLTGPYGYYRGLSDRPDILEILYSLGIRFTRTYARNANDWQPVKFEIQPFWYEPQGFPDILEFPIQGWQDCILRNRIGWSNTSGYLKEIKKGLDYISKKGLVWGYVQHDWSSIREDPEMRTTRNFMEYALKKDVKFYFYQAYYEKCKARKFQK